jgi:hypothetical protein
MGYNTPSDSPSPLPPPLPRFEFHPPGTDCPRLEWPDWISLVSLQLQSDYPGPVGLFLSSIVGAVACQARELGATDWVTHERLAQEEQDRAGAWLVALEAEVVRPGGHWEPDLSDDHNGGWDGHPIHPDIDPCANGAYRGYFAVDPGDETYMN